MQNCIQLRPHKGHEIMITTTSLTGLLAAQAMKNESNEKVCALREKIGNDLVFSSFPYTGKNEDITPRNIGDIAQVIENVTRYVAKQIAKSINKSTSFGKEFSSLDAGARLIQRAKEKSKASGNFYAFSEHDLNEIRGAVSLYFSAYGVFTLRPFNLAIPRNLLMLIVNHVKSIDCLELNRFRKGKHSSLDALQGEKSDSLESEFSDDDEFFNPSNEIFTPQDFAEDCDEIAKNNEDFDSLAEKIDAINSMIDCYHDCSDSRRKEGDRKKDKQFFQDCLAMNACGNGETNESWRQKKSRWVKIVVRGHEIMRENSNDGKSFNNFSHLATLFKS